MTYETRQSGELYSKYFKHCASCVSERNTNTSFAGSRASALSAAILNPPSLTYAEIDERLIKKNQLFGSSLSVVVTAGHSFPSLPIRHFYFYQSNHLQIILHFLHKPSCRFSRFAFVWLVHFHYPSSNVPVFVFPSVVVFNLHMLTQKIQKQRQQAYKPLACTLV